MNKQLKKIFVFGAILFFPFTFFYYLSKGEHKSVPLPIYGKILDTVIGDSIYHTVGFPLFINLINSDTVDVNDYSNTIKIIEFYNQNPTFRTVSNKAEFVKDSQVVFLSILMQPTERNIMETLNLIERGSDANLVLDKWEFLKTDNVDSFIQDSILVNHSANLEILKQSSNVLYILLDSKNRVRGKYGRSHLGNMEQDLRMLLKEVRGYGKV